MEALCYLYNVDTHNFRLIDTDSLEFAKRHNIPTSVVGPQYEEWDAIMQASAGIAEVMLDFPE
jgi:hypothetical protein